MRDNVFKNVLQNGCTHIIFLTIKYIFPKLINEDEIGVRCRKSYMCL